MQSVSGVLACLMLALAACGTDPKPPPATPTVTVSPATATVSPGGKQQFAATTTIFTNTAVIWSVTEGASGGTISATGLYTAPAAVGTYHVVATSQADATVSGSATVTVATGAIVGVSPATASLVEGANQQFTATVTGTANTAVTWSVTEGSAGGAVTNGGLYTAPLGAGTFHVVATSVADATRSATATATVTPPAVTVSLKPGAVSIQVGTTAQFTATVSNSTNPAVTWSVKEGASGGSITSGGLYTAPATTGTYHVVATSVAAPAASASADVVVRTPPQVGVWTNVTPSNVDLVSPLTCGNYGATTVTGDPMRPSDLYVQFNCQGIWKSTDFGSTWTGPINTGTNGPQMAGAGGISIPSASKTTPPLLYAANIRDPGTGFWRSTDGGVSWTKYNVAPGGSRQDFYTPAVDPYDVNHLLITGHEMNVLAQSTDGGQNWTAVTTNAGMTQNGGTAFAVFVDTGNAATTRNTFLWIAQQSGGGLGTWRTSDGGANWTKVDNNEHPHGNTQFYQPGNGVIYMAGAYSVFGWGVLRSTDYGVHWAHVGAGGNEAGVFGTAKKVYAMYGWAIGVGQSMDISLESADQPGTGTWSAPVNPAGMTQGPNAVAVTSDGTHSILVTSNYNAGLWLYIEP